MNNLTLTAFILISLVGVPLVIGAYEKALTFSALEKAYEVRIIELDNAIASSTKEYDVLNAQLRSNPKARLQDWESTYSLRKEINSLEEEKNTTEIAYKLLVEALK